MVKFEGSVVVNRIERKQYNETADDVLQDVYNEMDHLDVPIDEMRYRSSSKYIDENGKCQQQFLLKFNSWNAWNKFYCLR